MTIVSGALAERATFSSYICYAGTDLWELEEAVVSKYWGGTIFPKGNAKLVVLVVSRLPTTTAP